MGFDVAKLDFGKWLPLGFKVAAAIPGIIAGVEKLKGAFKSGADKEDAAVDLTKAAVEFTEGVVDKDLVNDPAVEEATRNAIKAIVALQNTITAVKAAKVAKQ